METPILPETGFVRIWLVLKFFPVSRSSWWAGVARGDYPKPCKLSRGVTAWRAEDIRALIAKHSQAGEALRQAA